MKRVLFVGLGGVGQRHLRNVSQVLKDDVEFIAYRTRRLSHVITPQLNADQGRNIEADYKVESFSDLGEALGKKPDIAFICNPTSLHIPIARKCAEAGCDLFLEKPLADSMLGVSELVRTIKERGLVGMVGYQLRFHPCYLKIAEIIASGRLGNLLAVRAMVGEYLVNWHPYEDYRTMYASRKDLGGGVILSQIHEMDYLFGLFGAPSRVFAMGGHLSDLEIDVEDTASIMMEFSWNGRSLPAHLHQDYLQSPGRRTCDVIGDQATVVADFRALTVTVMNRDGSTEHESFADFDRNNMFISETEHLLDCCETRKKPLVDVHDGAQSLRMALAAKQSVDSGKVVDLAEIGGE